MSEVYFTGDMKNHYSTSVLVDGYLYGYNDSILTAMQFATGKVAWKNRSVGKGSVAYADKRLYLLGEDGVSRAWPNRLPTPTKKSRASRSPKGSLPTWSPPVISDGTTVFARSG